MDIQNSRERIIKKQLVDLISPVFIKICCQGSIVVWITTLLLSLLFAQLDLAGPGIDPAGFSFIYDCVSNLGSISHTPMPTIFNFGMMITCLFLIPIAFYVKERIRISCQDKRRSKLRTILSLFFVFLQVIGLVFLFLAGMVNNFISRMWESAQFPFNIFNWHNVFASISFLALTLGGIFFMILILLYPEFHNNQIPKRVKIIFMINMWIITPTLLVILMFTPFQNCADVHFWEFLPWWEWATLWEWLLLISLSSSLVFLSYAVLKIVKPLVK